MDRFPQIAIPVGPNDDDDDDDDDGESNVAILAEPEELQMDRMIEASDLISAGPDDSDPPEE